MAAAWKRGQQGHSFWAKSLRTKVWRIWRSNLSYSWHISARLSLFHPITHPLLNSIATTLGLEVSHQPYWSCCLLHPSMTSNPYICRSLVDPCLTYAVADKYFRFNKIILISKIFLLMFLKWWFHLWRFFFQTMYLL